MSNKSHNKETSVVQKCVDGFRTVNKTHPVLMNIVYIIITGALLVFMLLEFVDVWTLHGNEAVVPPVKGNSLQLARMTLENDGFECEVMDSIFDSALKPGTVVEQTPRAGSSVKPGRKVYVTIVAYSPKMVAVPEFNNVSLRQARSLFEGLGLKVNVITVASEYKDLVMGAKVNGVPLRQGQHIPITATVTLEVGGGYDDGYESDEDLGAEYDVHDEDAMNDGTDE